MIVCPTWASHWWGRQENRNWSAKNSAIAMAPNIKKPLPSICWARRFRLHHASKNLLLSTGEGRRFVCCYVSPPPLHTHTQPPSPPTVVTTPLSIFTPPDLTTCRQCCTGNSVRSSDVVQKCCCKENANTCHQILSHAPPPIPHPPQKAAAVSTVFAATHEGSVLMEKCGLHKERLKHKWTSYHSIGGHKNRSINWLMACWMDDLMDGFVHVNQWKSFSSSTLRVRVSGSFPSNRVVGIFWKLRIVLVMNTCCFINWRLKRAREREDELAISDKNWKRRQQNRTKTEQK